MTEQPPAPDQPVDQPTSDGALPAAYQAPAVPAPAPPAYAPGLQLAGPPGKVRNTGTCFLLMIVTLGIYSIFWYYMVCSEMKRHTNRGLGGGLAVVLTLFVGIVMPYITSGEVGQLYSDRGQEKPVSGATGLWYFPGILLLGIGPIVWFVKTNGALNNYWKSLGAS